jgi:crotonobetainyl-CoA:carnitine CoA-transferase CaiB-like acyl-CoA transferase
MNRRHAPTLGGDNHEILHGLGMTPGEVQELEEDGVIGSRPGPGGKAF